MSAIPEEFLRKTSALSDEVTRPFAASKKIYVQGSRPDLRVPMREVALTPTRINDGGEENPPIYIYDTSGPYTDPAAQIDLRRACPRCASAWIRSATTPSSSPAPAPSTAAPARATRSSPTCASSTSARRAAPRPAPTCRRCTTPARASSPRRWNTSPSARTMRLDELRSRPALRQASASSTPASLSAPTSPSRSRPSSCAPRWPRARHHPRQHQPPGTRADDHRPQLPGEDQHQHRQLGGHLLASRRRSRRWSGRPAGAPTR